MIGEKQNHGNRAGTIHLSKSFTPFMINALFTTHSATLRATLRSHYTSFRSGRITRDIRFEARLAPHPNFAPFSRKTSYIPDVSVHSKSKYLKKINTENSINFKNQIMKRTFIYSLLLILISLNGTPLKSENNEKSKQKSKSKSTISSYKIGSEYTKTYEITQDTNDVTCKFNGSYSFKTDPTVEININLDFEKSGNQVKDILNTQSFSKFMDLNNTKSIEIDSLDYKVIDKEIKLKFIISLIKEENDKWKVIDKYSMVYSSEFNNPKPKIVVDKIEKISVEIIGNTY